MDVYIFHDYRSVILDWLQNVELKGARTKLAHAAECSASWLTRVLSGDVQLTPDQALGITAFLNLNEDETDYFMCLVEFERAATLLLKKRIRKKLELIKSESRKLKTSLRSVTAISEDNSIKYYSSWVYAAVHVACMMKPLSLIEVSKLTRLSEETVSRVVNDLRQMELIKTVGINYQATNRNVHLPESHPLSNTAHSSLRQKTIQTLQEKNIDGLHYSAVHCLSYKDTELIQKKLKDSIMSCRKIIEPSPSEQLMVFCVDWYAL